MPSEKIREEKIVSPSELDEINNIVKIRNEVIHGIKDHKSAITHVLVRRIQSISSEISKRISSNGNTAA
ncbi:MAG TPA: hypothetical protein VIZ65_10200 [Cellvibrionaceae bacterium]